MEYFNQTDPKYWSLSGYLQWRFNFADFSNRTYEYSVFIDIIRKISCQDGEEEEEGKMANLILKDWQVVISFKKRV